MPRYKVDDILVAVHDARLGERCLVVVRQAVSATVVPSAIEVCDYCSRHSISQASKSVVDSMLLVLQHGGFWLCRSGRTPVCAHMIIPFTPRQLVENWTDRHTLCPVSCFANLKVQR